MIGRARRKARGEGWSTIVRAGSKVRTIEREHSGFGRRRNRCCLERWLGVGGARSPRGSRKSLVPRFRWREGPLCRGFDEVLDRGSRFGLAVHWWQLVSLVYLMR